MVGLSLGFGARIVSGWGWGGCWVCGPTSTCWSPPHPPLIVRGWVGVVGVGWGGFIASYFLNNHTGKQGQQATAHPHKPTQKNVIHAPSRELTVTSWLCPESTNTSHRTLLGHEAQGTRHKAHTEPPPPPQKKKKARRYVHMYIYIISTTHPRGS